MQDEITTQPKKWEPVTQLDFIREGNIFDSRAQCFVNPVNTLGVSGAGLALQFKEYFPDNYRLYKQACLDGLCDIGKCYLTINDYPNFIINFPTKRHYKDPSSIDYIKEGMVSLLGLVKAYNIHSIAIPALGCGLGQLNKEEVLPLIYKPLWDARGITIEMYI